MDIRNVLKRNDEIVMANPFELKGKKECGECSDELLSGDMVYYHDDFIICEDCAESEGVVCDCGNYKKEEYLTCYECFQN